MGADSAPVLSVFQEQLSSSETQGPLVGAGKSLPPPLTSHGCPRMTSLATSSAGMNSSVQAALQCLQISQFSRSKVGSSSEGPVGFSALRTLGLGKNVAVAKWPAPGHGLK